MNRIDLLDKSMKQISMYMYILCVIYQPTCIIMHDILIVSQVEGDATCYLYDLT